MATKKPAATNLSRADRELVDAALAAREGAHAPWSKFKVGAAARFGDTIVKGCNVEFDVYGLTGCAERTAVFAAYACGAARAPLTAIAVVADTPSPVSPCGACRQVLYETGGPDLRVILTNTQGDARVTTMRELLPGGFRLEGTARTAAVRKAAQRRIAEFAAAPAKKSPRT
ncbi:MAG TPA: cytidine deaminase [Rudaea sp.]|nr:cytidine deaminase [Rudaea sp.]